jgi:hypothetical protein
MELLNDTKPNITQHAAARMRQRGYSKQDIALVRSFGTPVRNGYLLTCKDVRYALGDAREDRQRLERLIGTALIELEGNMITVYRARKPVRRKLMKNRT